MSESDLPLPGLTTSAVFTIRSSISIDAPRQKVWDVLLDFVSYREWRVDPFYLSWASITKLGDLVQEPIHVCSSFLSPCSFSFLFPGP
jgi:hypothetical protein